MSLSCISGRAWRQALPVFSVTGLLLLLGAAPGGATTRASGQIQITYVSTSSIRVSINGTTVPAGGSVPAGDYVFLVDDADYTTPKFQLTGPGISLTSDLNSTGMGIDRPAQFGPYTLTQGSSYVARDANLGISDSFTVGAAATAPAGTTTTSAQPAPTPSKPMTPAPKKTPGKLLGSVSTGGKASLTLPGGRSVKTLKAGIYKLTLSDHSKKAGLVVEKVGRPVMIFSSVAAVGSRSVQLTLSPGKWFFAGTTRGAKTYFTVTA